MIGDSIPWKRGLLRTSTRLERMRTQARWTERGIYLLEREVMVGAFVVRRLIESGKCSNALRDQRWPTTEYAITGAVPDRMYWRDVESYVTLSLGREAPLSALSMCQQFIHSFVFEPKWAWPNEVTRGELLGMYVASDHSRTNHIYFIPLETVVLLFSEFGAELIQSVELKRRRDGQWVLGRVDAIAPRPNRRETRSSR